MIYQKLHVFQLFKFMIKAQCKLQNFEIFCCNTRKKYFQGPNVSKNKMTKKSYQNIENLTHFSTLTSGSGSTPQSVSNFYHS